MRLESDKHMKILVTDLEYELFDFPLLCVALPKLADSQTLQACIRNLWRASPNPHLIKSRGDTI